MQINVYLISGLAVDEQAFERIQFPKQLTVHYLHWLEPYQSESLSEYACRMVNKVDTSKPFIIIGLSFGCLVAIEIAKLYPDQIIRLILISGICTSKELPMFYRRLGFFGFQHTFLLRVLKGNKWIAGRLFGSKPNSAFSQYLFTRLQKVSTHYLRWSIEQLLNWKQEIRLPVIRQIHGNKDSVFPLTTAQTEFVVNGAGHLMIRTHSRQVNRILVNIFQELQSQ